MMIHEMHIINDIVAVVGSNTIGMLPFGISPRLILEEFNGFMAMTPIYKIRAVDETHFVGINKGSIEYAIILFEN